jgi:hypothetical protein
MSEAVSAPVIAPATAPAMTADRKGLFLGLEG